MKVLTIADVAPDPNSGAAGTVFHTNVALRELGHEVHEIWSRELGPRKIAHGNLHSLWEQPRAYLREVRRATQRTVFDLLLMSQPQAYLAARWLRSMKFPGVVLNRSHGVELRVNEVMPKWHRAFGVRESRCVPVTRFLNRLLERQWSSIARYADGIVVGCTRDADSLCRREGIPKSMIAVIPHGIHDEFIRVPPPDRESRPPYRLLHVGQFAFIKGSTLLADIVNMLLPRNPNLHFTWVCSRHHHTEVKSRLLPAILSRVQLRDWMGQTELLRIYDTHDIFLFPSLFEGFGKAAFEAMARGMCVVSSDEGGMNDLVKSWTTGILCPAGDVNAFVSSVEQLITSSEVRQMGQNARKVAEELSWSRCARSICEFVERLKT